MKKTIFPFLLLLTASLLASPAAQSAPPEQPEACTVCKLGMSPTPAAQAPAETFAGHELATHRQFGKGEKTASVISEAELAEIFKTLATTDKIAFRYVKDGCYARAELVAYMLEKELHLKTLKYWSFGDLCADNRFCGAGEVQWVYHVAPVILVKKKDGSLAPQVLDPALLNHPSTPDEWLQAQNTHNKEIHFYCTERFNYTPFDIKQTRTEWKEEDLQNALEENAKFLDFQAYEDQQKQRAEK